MAQNYSADDGEPFVLHEVERPILGALLGIISVCAFCGNVLVILAFSLSKKLQNTTNVFVVNLSAADLITSISLPVNVVAITTPQHLPDSICVWCGFSGVVCVGCSVYTLACIAAYRMNVIAVRRRQLSRSAKAVAISVTVALTWIVPITLATVPLIFGLGEFGYNSMYSSCTWNSNAKGTYNYSLILSASYYPIPMLVIIASYITIFLILRKTKKRVVPVLPSATETSRVVPARYPQRAPQALEKRHTTVTKNMFYVVCAFLLCMTPYSVALVVPGSDTFVPYAAVILMFSSCVNPSIYATKHPDFGKVMRKIVTCQFNKIPHYVLK